MSLAPTIAPIVDYLQAQDQAGSPHRAMRHIAESGFRCIQLSAALPSMRPRELDRSARRDVLARMRRLEVVLAGIDLWIPLEHFADDTTSDRAMAATMNAIELAADFGGAPLSIEFPESMDATCIAAIHDRADVCGITIIDFGGHHEDTFCVGVDPAFALTHDADPAALVSNAKNLGGVRFSDADRAGRVMPGSGRLDVVALQAALMTATPVTSIVPLDLRSLANPLTAMLNAKDRWESTGLISTTTQ